MLTAMHHPCKAGNSTWESIAAVTPAVHSFTRPCEAGSEQARIMCSIHRSSGLIVPLKRSNLKLDRRLPSADALHAMRRMRRVADALRVVSRSAAALAAFAGVALAGVKSHRGSNALLSPEPVATAQPAWTAVSEGALCPHNAVTRHDVTTSEWRTH